MDLDSTDKDIVPVKDYEGLTEQEFYVAMGRVMFKHDVTLALAWINAQLPEGEDISIASYYRILAKINQESMSRLNNIAIEFSTIVADEVVKMLGIEKELWKLFYNNKNTPLIASKILMDIVGIQPFITSLLSEVRNVIQNNALRNTKEAMVAGTLGQEDEREDRSTPLG